MSTSELKSLLRACFLGIVVSGLMILSGYAQLIQPVQDLLDRLLIPVQAGITSVDRGIHGFFSGIGNFGSLRSENQELHEELIRLQSENSELEKLKGENEFLRDQAGVITSEDEECLTAKVIAFDRDLLGAGRVKINVGSDDGVEEGRVVLASRGVLFGRVVEVSKFTSMVEVITVPTGKIPVKTQKGSRRGLLTGEEDGKLVVENVNRDYKIQIGDRVLTTGEDGDYPEGLLVGIVQSEEEDTSSSFKTLRLELLFDMTTQDYVLVEAE